MRWVDVGRFTTEVDRDRVCIPTKNEIVSQPRWDVYVNHQTAMKKRLGDIFLKVSNKVIIRQRAARRIKAIKSWLSANSIKSRADCKKMVNEDYRTAMMTDLGGGDGSSTGIDSLRYSFAFSKKQLATSVRLPLEYEANLSSFMETIDAQPVVSFDDLAPFEPIE